MTPARRGLEHVLAPLLQRDPDVLATRLPVGSPDHCLRVVDAYAAAGAQRMLLWPVRDPIEQLELFARAVRPHMMRSAR